MVLVHLAYEKDPFKPLSALGVFFGEFTRYAAGGFVFVAGLSMGAIFLPRARNPAERWKTYRAIWRRCLRLTAWQYLAGVALIGLAIYRGAHPAVTDYFATLRNILIFREGGDLLPLYIILIAFAPVFMEVLRRQRGWVVLFCVSLCLFIRGLYAPYQIAVDPNGNFPPLLWQLIFVLGLLAGSILPWYDGLASRNKWRVAGAAWLLIGFLWVADWGWMFGVPRFPVWFGFQKVPLNEWEALRYLSMIVGIITATDLIWRTTLAGGVVARFSGALGRNSLPIYVAHLFLMELAGILGVAWGLGVGQILVFFTPPCLILLWLLALLLDARKRQRVLPRPTTANVLASQYS
jgi:hypothetical protein